MKKFTNFLFLTLASVLILSGCSIEPRVYMSGYNIKWKSKFNHQEKQQNKDENTIVKKDASETNKKTAVAEAVTPSLLENDAKSGAVKQNKTDKYTTPLVASASSEKYIAPKDKTNLTPPNPEVKKPNKLNSKIQKVAKKLATVGGDHKGMAIAGLILSIVGALLIKTIVFPFIFGLLGIIFSAIGMKDAKIAGLIGLILGILDVVFPILLITILVSLI